MPLSKIARFYTLADDRMDLDDATQVYFHCRDVTLLRHATQSCGGSGVKLESVCARAGI
jgi:hypothetical protein